MDFNFDSQFEYSWLAAILYGLCRCPFDRLSIVRLVRPVSNHDAAQQWSSGLPELG